jgi:hypothetical protein
MNAYELAEQAEGLAYEIPADWSSGEPKNVATDIANMLRQQADRIKDLEKLLEHSVGADCREMRYIQEIENKDARIAELEKRSEPAAWMHKESGQVFAGLGSPMKPNDFIPLYTTPQIKELSDEEIEEIAVKWYIGTRILPIGFAKAILKKAIQ